MKKAYLYGVASALFFAVTFLLNRSMNLSGGSYLWSSSLRYFFMFPMLFALLYRKEARRKVYRSIKENPVAWMLWSTVGFGLFYLPLSFASSYGASWLVAGTWQITIIAGALLSPVFGKKIPLRTLGVSAIIIVGVIIMQLENATQVSGSGMLFCVIPVLIAAVAYPLGNRKMMEVCQDEFSTMERVYGMTLCSLPFWAVTAAAGYHTVGLPSSGQVMQSFLVALFSGVIATLLFFKATEMVKEEPHHLAAVEATQAGEVVFTLLGSVVLLNDTMPGVIGIIGLVTVIAGMIINSVGSTESA